MGVLPMSAERTLQSVPLTDQLRKCKVKGCKNMARITDYWYCREHRVWLRSGVAIPGTGQEGCG